MWLPWKGNKLAFFNLCRPPNLLIICNYFTDRKQRKGAFQVSDWPMTTKLGRLLVVEKKFNPWSVWQT